MQRFVQLALDFLTGPAPVVLSMPPAPVAITVALAPRVFTRDSLTS